LLRSNLFFLARFFTKKPRLRAVKELARSYLTMTKDLTRVMVRLKALYRSWANSLATKQVTPRGIVPNGWRKSGKPAYTVEPTLLPKLDALRSLQQQVKKELLLEGRKHSATKLLRSDSFIGPIRAVLLLALIQTLTVSYQNVNYGVIVV